MAKFSRGGKWCISGLLLLVALVAYNNYANRQSGIQCTRDWARLAPFPPSHRGLVIETTGSMFTRGFNTSFIARTEDVDRWLKASPGTRDDPGLKTSSLMRQFEIKPGSGAQRATLNVHPVDSPTPSDPAPWSGVAIMVYWS